MTSIEPIYKQFGARLHKARNEARMTQSVLASRVNVTRTSITNIEAGRQRLPLHMVYDLAAALGIDHIELLPAAGEVSASLPPELKRSLVGQQEGVEGWVVRVIGEDRADDGEQS